MHSILRWLTENADAFRHAAIAYCAVIWLVELVIHEAGHMYFQRKYGVKVLFLKVGIGPTLFTFRLSSGTMLIIGIPLPLMGESRSVGERDDYEAERGNPESLYYIHRNPLERVVMAAAGPLVTLVALLAACVAYQTALVVSGNEALLAVYITFAIVGVNELMNLFIPFAIPRLSRKKRWQRSDAFIVYEGLWEWMRRKS